MAFRYFVATDNQATNGGTELYATDGTAAGTGRVADINPGPGSSNPADFVTLGTKTFFTADDGTHGRELWVFNSTTDTVTRLDALPASSTASYKSVVPGSIIAVSAARVIFTATDNGATNGGTELWTTDGTTAGTKVLSDINPGPGSSNPQDFTVVPGIGALFTADDGTHGRELWFTDGITATRLDKQPAGSTADYKAPDPATVVVTGAVALFAATDNQATASGNELYVTNGTAAGTTRLADINAGPGSSNPANVVFANGSAFFTADDGIHGTELYVRAGATITRLDRLPASGTADYKTIVPSTITAVGNRVVFLATDNQATNSGAELWSTDGTAAGTAKVADINAGPGSSNPGNFVVAGALAQPKAFFTADDGVHGVQVYAYNSATNTVTRLDPLPAAGAASYKSVVPGSITLAGSPLGTRIVFTATDNTATATGAELYSSDGTAAGTGRVSDINPGPSSSNPANFVLTAQNNVLFEADNGAQGTGLYFFGAAGNTVTRLDSMPGGVAAYKSLVPGSLTVLGVSQAVFTATDNTSTNSGAELYFTDYTAAGTVKVADINPGAGSSNPSGFEVIGGKAFFLADDGTHGAEMYVFDPAAKTTTRLDKGTAATPADYKATALPAGTIYGIAPVDAAKSGTAAGNLAYTFKVLRTGDSSVAATLRYAVTGSGTTPATAANFTGNTLPNGTVSFLAGQTEAYVTVNVAGNPALAQSAGFTVSLSLPSGVSAGSTNTGIAAPSAAGTIQAPTPTPTPTPTPVPTTTTVPALVTATISAPPFPGTAAQVVTSALSALSGSATVSTSTTSAGPFAAAVAGNLNVAIATAPVSGTAIALPTGYGGLIAQGSGAATLSDAGTSGAVLASGTGPTIFNSTGAGVTLVGGNAANRFNLSGSATVLTGDGASTVAATGSAAVQVTTGTGGSTVVLAGGTSTVQSNGQDTVFGGAGMATVTAAKGLVAVGGAGLFAFIGGSATSVVFGGGGGLTYTAGSAYDIAVGGSGTMNGKLGTAGGQLWGNSGSDVLLAAGTATGVVVANKGGTLLSSGSAGNFLVAGAGNVTLDGSQASGADVFFGGNGKDTFLLGSGNDLVGTGTGTSTVQLGAGKSTIFAFGTSTVTSGTGSADIVMGGTVQLNVASGAARTFALFNFVPGTDKISLSGYGDTTIGTALANQVNGSGQTVLTLSDNTKLQLIGVAKADASFFS